MKDKKDLIFIWIIIFLLIVACLAFFFIKPSVTGNIVLDNYTRTGYANPDGLFSLQQDKFSLSHDNQIVNLNMNVTRANGYVYKWGWYWNFATNDWVPFELTGNSVEGSPWIIDSSSTSVKINATDRLYSGENFIVVYSCIKNGKEWRCGCEDADDDNAECNKWILQIFNVSNVIYRLGSISPPCSNNYDCVEGKCVAGVCQYNLDIPVMPMGTAIHTCEELQNIKNNLSGSYYLANDIDCSDTINWNDGKGFDPIRGQVGSDGSSFTGSLNGQGYVIKDLFVNRSDEDFVSLFEISNGKISNVGLTGFYIYGNSYVAGLVGENGGNISNSHGAGTVIGHDQMIGGLTGYSYGKISQSSAMVRVNGVGEYVGGLVGFSSGSSLIENSYSRGSVYSETTSVGGFAGYNGGTIKNSYSASTVNREYAGSFIGYYDSGDMLFSFWDKTLCSLYPVNSRTLQHYSSGINGKTTAEMKMQSTYSDWDFTNIWAIDSSVNNGYPYLRSEYKTVVPLADACSHSATDPDCWSTSVVALSWGPNGIITNANDDSDGKFNTDLLANLESDYPAADYCYNLEEDGYDDWYLPAKDELWDGWNALGWEQFPSNVYFSSTEYSIEPDDFVWVFINTDPENIIMYKYVTKQESYPVVRCLR